MDHKEILDTTAGDTGAEFEVVRGRLEEDRAAHVGFAVGDGDTVVLEGKVTSAHSYQTLYSTDDGAAPQRVELPRYVRARRTVDGGAADSTVWLEVFGLATLKELPA